MMIGLQNYGPWFDIEGAGINSVTTVNSSNVIEVLSGREWTYQVGTDGEILGLDKLDNADSSFWTSRSVLPTNQSLIWYQNYGPWFVIEGAGINSVITVNSSNVIEVLSGREWTYQVGTDGEILGLDKLDNADSSFWTSGSVLPTNQSLIWYQVGTDGKILGLDKLDNAYNSFWTSGSVLPTNQSLIWYQTSFTPPKGNGPLAINFSSMGKGEAWVNAQSIWRYWSAYLAPSTGCSDECDYRGEYNADKCLKDCGQPTQVLYHVPRTWVHSGENLLVLHEELGDDPSQISVDKNRRRVMCTYI